MYVPLQADFINLAGEVANLIYACAFPCSYEVDIYEARPFIGGKVASYVDKDGNHIEVGMWVEHSWLHIKFNLFATTHSQLHETALANVRLSTEIELIPTCCITGSYGMVL